MSGHGEVIDSRVCRRVADVVADAPLEHPLTKRLLKLERYVLERNPPRPVADYSLRNLAPVADLSQQREVDIEKFASHA
jgi:hypothetical protein